MTSGIRSSAPPRTDPFAVLGTVPEGAPSILLVEDDFLLRTVSMGTLCDLGYPAIEVPDAQRALTILNTYSEIKVLMTDVNLPDMDGTALALEARRLRPGIRVLFVTGYGPKVMKDLDMSDGSIGYLSKPYKDRDLDRALKRLITI